ncbi:MAG: rod shape-determining protein MreC [Methylocystaceae bacterium]
MGAIWRNRWWWLVIVIILALLSLAHWSGQERSGLTVPERVVRVFYGYLQTGVAETGSVFDNFGFYLTSKERLHNDNKRLQAEADQLRLEIQRLKEYQMEAQRLQQLLGFRNYSPQYQQLGAKVIARSLGYWNETVFIDRGSADGVKRDLAVITPDGLIGRIINVQKNTSEVLLITSRQSGVGTVVQQTRAPGIVNGLGNDGYLAMNNIPYFVKIYKDDQVITSGLSSVFPPGIPVGKIVDVKTDQNGLTRSARLKPSADMDRLEEVIVVIGYNPQAAPSIQNTGTGDASQGRTP